MKNSIENEQHPFNVTRGCLYAWTGCLDRKAAVFEILCLFVASQASADSIETVLMTGLSAPDDRVFASARYNSFVGYNGFPVINNAGQVAVVWDTEAPDGSARNATLVRRDPDSSIAVIATRGDQAFGVEGVTYPARYADGFSQIRLNNHGDLAFQVGLVDGVYSACEYCDAIWAARDGEGLRHVMYALPPYFSSVSQHEWYKLGSFQVSSEGAVIASREHSNRTYSRGLYRETSTGDLKKFVTHGTQLPGTSDPPDFLLQLGGYGTSYESENVVRIGQEFFLVANDDRGQSTFVAHTHSQTTGDRSKALIRRSPDGDYRYLLKLNEVLSDHAYDGPYGTTTLTERNQNVEGWNDTVVSSGGNYASVQVTAGFGRHTLLRFGRNNEYEQLVTISEFAPDSPTGYAFDVGVVNRDATFIDVAVNDRGEVAFASTASNRILRQLDSSDGIEPREPDEVAGIWRIDESGGISSVFVRNEGYVVPGLPAGTALSLGERNLKIVMNASGQIAFSTRYVNQELGLNGVGIWAQTSYGELKLIAAEGLPIDVSDDPNVEDLRVLDDLFSKELDTGEQVFNFNDRGQIVFVARLLGEDGEPGSEGGVFVSNLVAGLPGDFNGDGTVDAADYTVWRDGLGSTYTEADHAVWANNFGATATSSETNAVPEPSASLLGALLLLALARSCRR